MLKQRSFWVPVVCGILILGLGTGTRQSFGIFQMAIAADFGVGRELWSFANALSFLLMGLCAPFVGALADRFGTAKIAGVGGTLHVFGLLLLSFADSNWLLIFSCAISGLGLSAAGMGPILAAIGRQTAVAQRSIALGFVTAGSSFGQFGIVPFASLMQQSLGDWHKTMFVLTAISIFMIPAALGLGKNHTTDVSGQPIGGQGATEAFLEAFSVRSYVLLMIGFFVCGFHVVFIGLHLPAYIADAAISMSVLGMTMSPIELGGWALGMIGLFNIIGCIFWGWLGGIHKKKDMLALLYALRSLAILLFLLVPLSWASVLFFAAILGFLWLGTVALTSGLIGFLFGPKHAAMLWGIVFLSHQVGSFLGGWGAGRWFDIEGNYDWVWLFSVAMGFVAAVLHWLIREEPVLRPKASFA